MLQKVDTLRATEHTHVEYGTIFLNSYGVHFVKVDAKSIRPLVWGKPYNNVKAEHISEAEVDSFIRHDSSRFTFQ